MRAKNGLFLSGIVQNSRTKVGYPTKPLKYYGHLCGKNVILDQRGDIAMFEFFVEKDANESGDHVVHMACCSALPEKDTLYYLGVRSNTAAPLKEAANWFSTSAPCPDCMPS